MNSQPRQSKRLKVNSESAPSTEVVSRDTTTFDGLERSLGYNLKKHAMSIKPISRKEKYFHFTCINGILDISNPSRILMLRSLPVQVSNNIIKKPTVSKTIQYEDFNIPSLSKKFSNISHRNGIQKVLLFIQNEHEDSPALDIYQFIVD
ncbi:hypothetical protein [Parasitella parasitica]|uniref:Uncharacterized protein n=1 Tax=Parasitella parasitica TaxID=35722 RepID=A0A0B7NCF3_9FUNG|nr:hypothetical protein [Parasitella parasitica]